MTKLRVWLAFALLALIWGSSYLFIRVGVRQLSPIALVALRLGVASVAITAIALIRGAPLRVPRRELVALVWIGSLNTSIPFLLISWGEVSVPSGLASVLNSMVPIFSVILAAVVLRDEPLSIQRGGGVLVGFVGVIVLLGRDLGGSTVQWSSIIGQAAIVMSSICYACGAVAVRRFLRGTPTMTVAAYSIWISALETGLASALVSRPPLFTLTRESFFAVLWLGVLGSAIAYTLAFFILDQWGAGRYTLVAYMLPATGLTLGLIFLHETLDWRILAGSILIILGVVLASLPGRPHRLQPPSSEVLSETRAGHA